MEPTEGWFIASQRDWLGVDEVLGLDALEGKQTPEDELLERFPIAWSGLVRILDWTWSSAVSTGVLKLEGALGQKIELDVLSGPVRVNRFETIDYDLDNSYWEVLGWSEIKLEHDCYAEKHSWCDDMVSFPDSPEILYWPLHDTEQSIRLEYLDLVDPHEFLPLREGSQGLCLFADEFLLEAVKESVLENPLKPADLPLPAEMLHVRAVFLEKSVSPFEECVGIEVWMPSEDRVFGGGAYTEKLIARRVRGRWSFDFGTEWLDATLDYGFRDPLYLPWNFVEVDVSRAHMLISLFDTRARLTLDDVKFLLGPADRMVRAENLPSAVDGVARAALTHMEYCRDFYEGEWEPPGLDVLHRVLESGGRVRLDEFLDALSFAAEHEATKQAKAERPWVEIEQTLHRELERCKTEVWSQITLQLTPDPSPDSLQSREWFEATYSQDSLDWFEAEQMQGPIAFRFEAYTPSFRQLDRGQEPIASAAAEDDGYPVEKLVDATSMDRLGFVKRGGDTSWVGFERQFLEILTPRLMARLVVRIIREATPLNSGLGIFLSGEALDGVQPGRQIWPVDN